MHEDCKEYFERISEYLDGELDLGTCEKIESHLRDCPECEDCFGSLKKSVKLCKGLPREEIPEDMRERLRAALRDFLKDHY